LSEKNQSAQTLYLIGHVLMNRLKILIIGSSVSGGKEEGHLIDGENKILFFRESFNSLSI
jgi:hypothetical protein